MAARGLVAAVAAALLLTGCATPPQTGTLKQQPPADLPRSNLLTDVPFYAQKVYQCGPAALAMLLNSTGTKLQPDQLVDKVYVPQRQGAFQVEMLAATRSYNRLALEISPRLQTLLQWLDAGKPVLVLQNLGLSWYPKWHYAVAIGYDLDSMEMVLHSGEIARYRIPMAVFERTWARGDHWGMTALQVGETPLAESEQGYFEAAAALEESRPDTDVAAAWAKGAELWPDNPDFPLAQANYHYRQGDHRGARRLYRQINQRFPDYLPAYNNLASLLLALGEEEAAIATAEAGLTQGDADYLVQTLAEARARRPGTQ